MAHYDSTGQRIKVGDTVLFRGYYYTIKTFGPLQEPQHNTAVYFEEARFTRETAREISIDLVDPSVKSHPDKPDSSQWTLKEC